MGLKLPTNKVKSCFPLLCTNLMMLASTRSCTMKYPIPHVWSQDVAIYTFSHSIYEGYTYETASAEVSSSTHLKKSSQSQVWIPAVFWRLCRNAVIACRSYFQWVFSKTLMTLAASFILIHKIFWLWIYTLHNTFAIYYSSTVFRCLPSPCLSSLFSAGCYCRVEKSIWMESKSFYVHDIVLVLKYTHQETQRPSLRTWWEFTPARLQHSAVLYTNAPSPSHDVPWWHRTSGERKQHTMDCNILFHLLCASLLYIHLTGNKKIHS